MGATQMSAAIVTQQPQVEPVDTWKEAQYLICELTIELPVPNFTVRDLLQLEKKSVVDTRCKQAVNLPINVNGQPVAWVEFEVLGDRLAVRLMELI
ncbi:MAG TPA: FliM/FliN family flagellar motor C-terminal domain-containing protein [Candidatus Angelobacter sp.]|jgi:flagellar motor switch/type III secretory pathway protein FliN|nr:FliM/FliN family flagellar motor C-terminal domain-containing protein [Candidatus Angelobacter sp.]